MRSVRSHRTRRNWRSALLYALLALGAVPILTPFFWMVSTSLKTREGAAEYPPRWLPVHERVTLNEGGRPVEVTELLTLDDGRVKIKRPDGRTDYVPGASLTRTRVMEPQWENYRKILRPDTEAKALKGADDDFPRFLLNTLLIAGMTVLGQILTCSLVAWGFARMRFTGRNTLFIVMLATMMLPGQITMVPTFMIYKGLGWVDTFLPLILPAWLGGAFFTFLYRQFFLGIPLEMDEAARMDGATPLGTYWNVLLPMAKPVTVTVGVFTFLGAWNEFLGPLIYLNSDHKRTLSLALAKFQSAYGSDVPMLMAAATLMLLPVLVLYFVSQRALVQGMVVSGVKG
jgi:ABC-type glycerol-3-phosphate transport system permease component